MAVYDLEEQEKLDEIKAWWKQWGNAIIAAVSVFVIVFSGIQWWRQHERALTGEAATAAMRGDILFAQGKLADAKNAYGIALAKTDAQGDKQLLQLKFDALGEAK